MGLTIRKEKGKYNIVDKETGKIKKSFETKGEALSYEEEPKKWDYTKLTKKEVNNVASNW